MNTLLTVCWGNRMDKPILKYQRGNWYCHMRALLATRIGIGKPPALAYKDWQIKTDHPDIAKAERDRILDILRKAERERANQKT